NTFKNKLEQNDVVAFSMEPGQGVEISLNGVVLDTIEEDEFFNLLLRTWIGNVPLSSTYRASLLQGGDVDSGLRSRFDAIAPSEARRAEVVAWTQEQESQSVAAAPSDRTTPDGSSPEVDAGIPAIALDLPPPDLRTRR